MRRNRPFVSHTSLLVRLFVVLTVFFVVFLVIGTGFNRKAEERILDLFTKEQVLQTAAVRNSIQENLNRIINESGILAAYSFPEFEQDLRSVNSMENLLRIELDSYRDSAAYSYIDFSGDKSLEAHDAGKMGELAAGLAEQWSRLYRNKFMFENSGLFVPKIVVSGGFVFIGLLQPVVVDSIPAGMLITVINIVEPLDRYIDPIIGRMSGTPVVVDDNYTILWDYDARLSGRSLMEVSGFEGREVFHDGEQGYRRMEYFNEEGRQKVAYFSWSVFTIGNERIYIVLISREQELLGVMDTHRNELRLLYILVTIFFSAVSFAFLNLRFLVLKQEVLTADQEKLEKIVDSRTQELRTLLNRYTILYESANDAINIMKDGVFIECNQKALELFDADDPSQFIGLTPGDVSPEYQEDGRLSSEKAEMYMLQSRISRPQVFEWQHLSLKGRFFYAEVSLKTIDVDGIPLTQAIVRDVSERVESSREKDAMMKEIHHRVKNNLAIINSFLHLQQEKYSDGKAREVIIDTQRRVDVMAKMHELLYAQESLSSLLVSDYFSEILDFFRYQNAETESFSLTSDFEEIRMGPDRAMYAGFILSELVDNAVRHGEYPVEVSMKKEGELIVIEVSDRGAGFRPDEEPAEKGMGVRIVKALEMQMEGSLQWYFDRGTRAVFSFSPENRSA